MGNNDANIEVASIHWGRVCDVVHRRLFIETRKNELDDVLPETAQNQLKSIMATISAAHVYR